MRATELTSEADRRYAERMDNRRSRFYDYSGERRTREEHRRSHTSEYYAYVNARNRCIDPRHKQYADYGGRGIRFRFNSFGEFFHELGLKPSPEHMLDRIDNDGHYEVGNVRWVTPSISIRNRRPPSEWKNKTRTSATIGLLN